MERTVLITGGSGLFAVNAAMILRDSYCVVIALHEKNISIPGISALKLDLGSEVALEKRFAQIRPDIVIHAAGLTSVEKCEESLVLAEHINVTLAENVAKVCFRNGVRLVHISTDHLFRGDLPFYTEESVIDPVNNYGTSKAAGEQVVLNACSEALVVRTNFYGWGTGYRKSFSDFIIDSLRSNRSVNLFEDVFVTPVLIEYLVQTIVFLVNEKATGIFNVVGDTRLSKYQFGLFLVAEFGLNAELVIPCILKDVKNISLRPHDMSLSNAKCNGCLGIQLPSLRDQIRRLREQESEPCTQLIRSL